MTLSGNRVSNDAENRPRRRKALGLALSAMAVAGALVLSACSGAGADGNGSAGDTQATEQVLRFAISNEPTKLTTGLNEGTVANTMLTLLHRGLMAYDSNGDLTAGLAKSIEQPDGLTYNVELWPDLSFHDGEKLTSDNVKNTLDYYANEKNGSTLYPAFRDIDSVEIVDESNAVIHLSKPNSAFLYFLATPAAAIVPDASLNADGKNWIGAGPFVLEDHTDGIGLTLTKFDGYFDADNVALEEIDMSFYADGEARTNALISGDVDFIDYVPWENFERVANTPGLTVDAQAGPWQYVNFNVTDGPFADPKVREAVAFALNRDNSVAAAFLGNGTSLYGPPISESDPAFDPSMTKLWSYDPAKAKALLAEAGYPDGFSATLLTTSQYAFLQDTALSVQADLEAIGITVTLDAPDWPTRIAKGNEGDYDIAVSGAAGMLSDPTYLNEYITGPSNYSRSVGYNNDELNAAMEAGLRATTDSEKKAAYKQAFEIIRTDVPFATLSMRDQAFAFNSSVKGFKNLPGFLTFYGGYSFVDVSMVEAQ